MSCGVFGGVVMYVCCVASVVLWSCLTALVMRLCCVYVMCNNFKVMCGRVTGWCCCIVVVLSVCL